MKRSKMLKHISEEFEAHLLLCNLGTSVDENGKPDGREHVMAAKNLLSLLEYLGMRPPFGPKIIERNIIDRWGQDTGKKEVVRVIDTHWEDEDET
jgi:hypothetical protein